MGTPKTAVVCLSVVCLLSLPARNGAGADGAAGLPLDAPNPGPVRIGDPFTARAVRNALAGATRRLLRARCHEVFADFSDAEGRSLQQNLLLLGETGGSYIENRMMFYDGKEKGRCSQSNVIAYTQPGSRVVLVCGRAFQSAYWSQPRVAEAILIHETLHSLGLGENPPSSVEITKRVLRRCQG
jgi:hypothetical protein